MATASVVRLTDHTPGVFPASHIHNYQPIDQSSSATASKLLQRNHDDHHVFYSSDGFHNHIAHHLLSIFALGAKSAELQHAYDINAEYQSSQYKVNEDDVAAMSDSKKFISLLGKEKNFHTFEAFFGREIEKNPQGWQSVVKEYLFGGTEVSETMLGRMFGGFLHPIIHLGYGIEFAQPAIVVEALAQAAVHDDWTRTGYLAPAEKEAASKNTSKDTPSIVSLIDYMHDDPKISSAPHMADSNKIRDGLLVRAPDETISAAASYALPADPSASTLAKATAEMINACAYFTLCSQRPGKSPKIDFFYMHAMNCSIFYTAIMRQDWISADNKKRLLEWKVRMDLALYASRGCPKLDLGRVKDYIGIKGEDETWEDLFHRANKYEDDGHLSKLIRALGNGGVVCKEYEGEDGFLIIGDMWRKGAQMVMDSVEGCERENGSRGPRWVRSTGFAEAWDKVPDLKSDGARL